MARKIDNLIEELDAWLRFHKQMGLESLPVTPGIKSFLGDSGTSQDDQDEKNIEIPESLEKLRKTIQNCKRCNLHKSRHNVVFGEGPPDARLMIIGEAPGKEEDLTGRPFVGASGQLLTKMLKAIEIDRKEVFITSILKCRPPGNRTPKADEIKSCMPFLMMQIKLIKPKLILALGTVAAHSLLKTNEGLKKLRGRLHYLNGIKLIVTYHPAYILRFAGAKQKALKAEAWNDLQLLQREYRKLLD